MYLYVVIFQYEFVSVILNCFIMSCAISNKHLVLLSQVLVIRKHKLNSSSQLYAQWQNAQSQNVSAPSKLVLKLLYYKVTVTSIFTIYSTNFPFTPYSSTREPFYSSISVAISQKCREMKTFWKFCGMRMQTLYKNRISTLII